MLTKDYVPTRVLHDFVGRIEPLGIRYMLTGSMAMIRYTVFRQTADIDIILELSDSLDKADFINALESDYYVPHNAVGRAFQGGRMFNVIHIETAFKVDCIVRKSNNFQKSAFERREKTDYYGEDVWVISKEDLILSKLWWAKDTHSEMQFKDIKNLMQAGFDIEYAKKWTEELGITDSFQKCLNEIKE
ncbi:MAG: hypothetical protein M3405_06810 [Acidobacteriota bacterium]|jgi:hypothetical protein|nr:hypothetical protein [Acidobacteriota bacterium]